MGDIIMDMEDAPFIKSITEDLNVRHKGRFMVITGPPGEGKSFTGARLCEIIDPSFTVDRIAARRAAVRERDYA